MFKSYIKRVTAFVIMFMLIFSTPLTVYADTIGGNVGGGGSGNMDASIVDYKEWSFRYQGYRFYIINSEFERVTDVYDFLFTEPTEVGYQCYDTRFDGPESPKGKRVYTISRLAEFTGSSTSEIPAPVRNNQGYGDTFREWFLKNIPYTSGGGTLITAGQSKPSTPSKPSGSASSSNSSSSSSTTSAPVFNTIGDVISDMFDRIDSMKDKIQNQGIPEDEYPEYLKTAISKGNSIAFSSSTIEFKKLCNKLTTLERAETIKYLSNALTFYNVYMTSCKEAHLYITTPEAEKYAIARVRTSLDMYELRGTQKDFLCAFIYKNREAVNILDSIPADRKKIEEDLLSQMIPLSGETDDGRTESVDGCPAQLLLNEIGAITVNGYETAFEAMLDNHYLIVEPICWLYVPSNGVNYPEQGKRTYGSYWNLAKKWVEQGGRDTGGFYASYMTELGNNCMVLNSDVTSDAGITLKRAAIKVE